MTNEQIEQAAEEYSSQFVDLNFTRKCGFEEGAKWALKTYIGHRLGSYFYVETLCVFNVTHWMPLPEPPDNKEVTKPTKCNCPDDQCLLGDHPTCRWKD